MRISKKCCTFVPEFWNAMKPVRFYTIKSSGGLRAEISNLGAKITKLLVPDAQGALVDVVLGFRTPEEWRTKETYFNAVCGRVANRIKNGTFTLQGNEYHLPINNGPNSLHGGIAGFNARVWDVVAQCPYEITLHYRAKDGEEGYPANLDVYVTYTVTRDNTLRIHYEALTDAPTVVSLTNHAYFNLAGEGSGPVYEHVLQVFADTYTPLDETACPTGEIASVKGTPLDFIQPHAIGQYPLDHNWCLCAADAPRQLRHAATLQADGRTMECWTTMKGLQVYTGNFIEPNIGKSGKPYDVQHAVCLEAQNWPDAVHHPTFPSIVLLPGERLDEITEYRFI